MAAYYNEIDPKKGAWLRELIAAGLIAKGEVDERSITDVQPGDLRGFRQCHFFAGIGIWSYALRLAGWPDDREVWTGSCPCQPFSAAGKGEAFNDERHLWPEFFRLIQSRRPVVCFGEQVSSIDGLTWFDLVQADMDREDYTIGVLDTCAASLGAPHWRQRLYWVADTAVIGHDGRRTGEEIRGADELERFRDAGGLADSDNDGSQARRTKSDRKNGPGKSPAYRRKVAKHGAPSRVADSEAAGLSERERSESTQRPSTGLEQGGTAGRLADTDGSDSSAERQQRSREQRQQPEDSSDVPVADALMDDTEGIGRRGRPNFSDRGRRECASGPAGPVNGFWRDADWVLTRPKRVADSPGLRPIERGSFPLANGTSKRVGRLRGYGDGIVAQVAEAFIRSYMELNR